MSLTQRNINALSKLSPRPLQHAQNNHPDHRHLSDSGNPFPCPSNGVMNHYADIEFRNTTPDDLPEGMIAPKRRGPYRKSERGSLERSKWDFAYMASGSSLAIRIFHVKGTAEYNEDYKRIREIGMRMWRYQKSKGYIDPGFLVQTHPEDIVIGKMPSGQEISAPHIVFWRIDGTRLDPEYQGN